MRLCTVRRNRPSRRGREEQKGGTQGPEQLGRERGQNRGFSRERGRLPLSPRLPRARQQGGGVTVQEAGDPFPALVRRSETNR